MAGRCGIRSSPAGAPRQAAWPLHRPDVGQRSRSMIRFSRSWWQLLWLLVIAAAAFVFLQNSHTYGYALKPLTLAISVAVAVVGLDLLFGAGHQLNLGQG